jgi:hypothetical protein
MTNSWIASPPLIKTDESSINVHHFNPIENLLIEHASMSVYEQIASKTRNRRQKKIVNDNKLDEQTEEEEDDDEDDKTSMNHLVKFNSKKKKKTLFLLILFSYLESKCNFNSSSKYEFIY